MSKKLVPMYAALPIGSLEAYIHQVNQIPMLSQEEETALAEKYRKDSDLEAARQLVLAHLRFVVKVAAGYSGYGLNQGDLIQEGNIGLMKAVKRFDPAFGVRLVSFAVHWIKAEIHDFVIRNWRIVKIATTKAQRKLFFNLRNSKKKLMWFTPDEVKEVAAALNVSEREVQTMEQRLYTHDAAFDWQDEEDESGFVAPVAYLEDKSMDPAMLIEESDHSQNMEASLTEAFANLDPRSQDILQHRLLAEEKLTLSQLAEKYGVSMERVRQIEKNALNKLKEQLAN